MKYVSFHIKCREISGKDQVACISSLHESIPLPININIKTFHKEMGCDSTEIKSGSLSRLSHSTASDEFLVLKGSCPVTLSGECQISHAKENKSTGQKLML